MYVLGAEEGAVLGFVNVALDAVCGECVGETCGCKVGFCLVYIPLYIIMKPLEQARTYTQIPSW